MAGVDIISGGSNLKNVQMRKTFLKKGEGRGGSPTEFDLKIDEDMMNKTVLSNSKVTNSIPTGPIIMPVKRSNNVTTVRMRNKNNSVVFGQALLNTTQSFHTSQHSMMKHHSPRNESLLWQKKRAT